MFTLDNHLEQIEKHFSGSLNKEEADQFNQLKNTNPDFEELVSYFDDFMVGMEDFGDRVILLELQNLEKIIQKEEADAANQYAFDANRKIKDIAKGFFSQIDYTLDQLASLFQPVNTYQALLGTVHRGEDISIKMKKKEWDLAEGNIEITFSKATSSDLSISIENNQRQTLWTSTISKGTTSFLLTADELNIYTPGRYYWKVNSSKESVIYEFFVRKDLMP